MNRRSFIASSTAFLATAAQAEVAPRRFVAAHDLPLGVQLYAVSSLLDSDFQSTLDALNRIGYRTVELAGLHGRSGQQVRTALDRAGLICRNAHVAAQKWGHDLNLGDDLGVVADQMHAIGVETVVMPVFVIPDRLAMTQISAEAFRAAGIGMRADDWKNTADFINAKAKALSGYGLRFAYHNHNFEFAPLGGTTGYDILLNATDPSLVNFELDAGWAAAAGRDPVALLRAHPHRFRAMHVKDIAPTTKTNFALEQQPIALGQGKIDWARILPAAYAAGVTGFYVEQEPPYVGDRLAVLAAALRYLETLPA